MTEVQINLLKTMIFSTAFCLLAATGFFALILFQTDGLEPKGFCKFVEDSRGLGIPFDATGSGRLLYCMLNWKEVAVSVFGLSSIGIPFIAVAIWLLRRAVLTRG
ncbi:MAG: hypothetical protein ACPGOV_16720 [Magnetovibrionaceae bacterium]